jgi:PPOX class probable F420-dependent enzyme
MIEIDTSTEFGERVSRHLENDRIIWITTVGPDTGPQPSPVWFLWDGDTVLIFSQPDTPKLRNIQANPRVSLNFNSNANGGDVVVMTGDAWIDLEAPALNNLPEYVEKYTDGLQGISMTAEQFAAAYSVPFRVRPASLRGH